MKEKVVLGWNTMNATGLEHDLVLSLRRLGLFNSQTTFLLLEQRGVEKDSSVQKMAQTFFLNHQCLVEEPKNIQ